MFDQGREFGWQNIEDAFVVLEYQRIQIDNPRDPAGDSNCVCLIPVRGDRDGVK